MNKIQQKKSMVSNVIPLYNEAENVLSLIGQQYMALQKLDRTYEIILANDGAGERTWQNLIDASSDHADAIAVNLTPRHGQTAAIAWRTFSVESVAFQGGDFRCVE